MTEAGIGERNIAADSYGLLELSARFIDQTFSFIVESEAVVRPERIREELFRSKALLDCFIKLARHYVMPRQVNVGHHIQRVEFQKSLAGGKRTVRVRHRRQIMRAP